MKTSKMSKRGMEGNENEAIEGQGKLEANNFSLVKLCLFFCVLFSCILWACIK